VRFAKEVCEYLNNKFTFLKKDKKNGIKYACFSQKKPLHKLLYALVCVLLEEKK